MGLGERLVHAWNAFNGTYYNSYSGVSSAYRQDRVRLSRGNERSIITSIYNRIAVDCAAIAIKHVRLDEEDRYLEDVDSGLNTCLTLEANLDQSGRAFIQDVVMSLLDEGCVAIVPVDTDQVPRIYDEDGKRQMGVSLEILSLRVGKIVQWFPKHVRVSLYNDQTGEKQEVMLPKSLVAIVENPFYSVMNEPSSTAQRLNRKLVLLDDIDQQSGAGKLDMIIQLPYVLKSKAQKDQAEARRKQIEDQLRDSKYGIAYTDGTEKIVQLNRSLDNNLMKQIEYLTSMLYSQLGITKEIMDGTADAQVLLNYSNHTIEPILSAIVDEMKRKFLTKTARSQKQSILYFRDPFKLVPIEQVAEMADKFTRNEIMSSNEFRQVVGLRPSSDPAADELRNKNLNQSNEQLMEEQGYEEEIPEEEYEDY